MFYRVMSYDGEMRDFDYTPEGEVQARAFYLAKRKLAERVPIPIDAEVRPSVNIHRCYHRPDGTSDRACEIIESYVKG